MDNATPLDAARSAAHALMSRFLTASPAEAMALTLTLEPRPSDWIRVFAGPAAARAEAGYRELWAAPVAPQARAGQSTILLTAATALELQLDTERSRAFPGGYRQIAHLLQPDRIWVAWKYVAPGERVGMAWDGLVWLDDHWAWFPKPWRVLSAS